MNASEAKRAFRRWLKRQKYAPGYENTGVFVQATTAAEMFHGDPRDLMKSYAVFQFDGIYIYPVHDEDLSSRFVFVPKKFTGLLASAAVVFEAEAVAALMDGLGERLHKTLTKRWAADQHGIPMPNSPRNQLKDRKTLAGCGLKPIDS